MISKWAGHSGPIDQFQYKFSFGDGSEGPDHHYSGYPMMTPGRIVRMGLVAKTSEGLNSGRFTVCVVVDGEAKRDYKVAKPEDKPLAVTRFR